MKNFARRVNLFARGMVVFKDWDIWLAERLDKNTRSGMGVFRLRNGIEFAIDYSTTRVGIFNEIWLGNYYERYYRIQPKDVVIDIGAHIGAFSVLAGYKGATVYAYEPTEGTYKLLKKNTEKYNVHAYHLAVSDVLGEVTFFEAGGRGSSGNTMFPIESPANQFTTRATTLKEIFAENHIERCDLLKMDCEGAETEILRNAPKDTFRKIKNIAMEYHGNLPEVKAILESKGYRILETQGGDLGYLWAVYAEPKA